MKNIFSLVMESSLDTSQIISELQKNSKEFDNWSGHIQGLPGYVIAPKMNEKSPDIRSLYEKLFEYLKMLVNEQDYNKYLELLKSGNRIFTELIWDFSENPIRGMDYGFTRLNEYKVKFSQTRPEKSITIKNTDRLFHTSSKAGITSLSPCFKSYHDGIVETLYPSKRIYFAKNYPMNRYGLCWDGKGRVYEYKHGGNITAKIDEELGKPACLIETSSDISVIDVTDEILSNRKAFKYDIFKTNEL
jgi:hypothetical protein